MSQWDGLWQATGHFGWFNNATALNYSYQAVDAAISFIQAQQYPHHYTLEPINEPVDNPNLEYFASRFALSDAGAAYVTSYIQGVLSRVQAINPNIPVMFQDGFRGEAHYSASFSASDNLVFDILNYYFAGRPVNSDNATTYICSDVKATPGDGKFPTFVGEWSIQTEINNTFAERPVLLNTGLYAFAKYAHGSTYWTAKFTGNGTVDGQGTQKDYWNYETFI
jgi:hypothetical protein